MSTDVPLKREHHFVPQFYLKQWSNDGLKIQGYPLLVPRDHEIRWKLRSIRSVARLTDLYTSTSGGTDSDEVEKWFQTEFEDPAVPVFRKIAADEQLASSDWEALVRFAGMQSTRTIAGYVRVVDRVSKYGESLLQSTLAASVKQLERSRQKGRAFESPAASSAFPISVSPIPAPDGNGGYLKAEFTIGRELFLWDLREMLPRLLPKLLKRRWTIVRPSAGMEWITSDDPFIALRYNTPADYSFTGGWAKSRGDLFLPLTPNHLLFAPLHDRPIPCYSAMSPKMTFEFQKMTVESAHRWIFAREPFTRVTWFRKPRVDRDAYTTMLDEARSWHLVQTQAEAERGTATHTDAQRM